MSLQKFQDYSIKKHICNKCGSPMHKRRLPVKKSTAGKSKRFHYIKILQCYVCRHWIEIEKK